MRLGRSFLPRVLATALLTAGPLSPAAAGPARALGYAPEDDSEVYAEKLIAAQGLPPEGSP
ncbi:hypothetical protein AB0E83_28245, partial [Streptomyces sp. NPDC035033]